MDPEKLQKEITASFKLNFYLARYSTSIQKVHK